MVLAQECCLRSCWAGSWLLLGGAPLPLQLPWRPVVAAAPGEQHGAGTARCLAPRGHESLRRTALHLRQAGQHPPPLALPRPPAASSVGPGWGAAAAPPAAVGDTLAARAGEAGAATKRADRGRGAARRRHPGRGARRAQPGRGPRAGEGGWRRPGRGEPESGPPDLPAAGHGGDGEEGRGDGEEGGQALAHGEGPGQEGEALAAHGRRLRAGQGGADRQDAAEGPDRPRLCLGEERQGQGGAARDGDATARSRLRRRRGRVRGGRLLLVPRGARLPVRHPLCQASHASERQQLYPAPCG